MLSDEEEELRSAAQSLESADADTGEGMMNAALLQWLWGKSGIWIKSSDTAKLLDHLHRNV